MPDSSSDASGEQVRYQWFWAGTQDESRRLSPDLRHAVKRHVVVKRIVPEEIVVPLSLDKAEGVLGDATATKEVITTWVPRRKKEARHGQGEELGGGEMEIKTDLEAGSVPLVVNDTNPGTAKRETPQAENRAVYTWDSLLDFSFSVQVCRCLPIAYSI